MHYLDGMIGNVVDEMQAPGLDYMWNNTLFVPTLYNKSLLLVQFHSWID